MRWTPAFLLLLSSWLSAQITYRIDTIAGSDYVGDSGGAISAQLDGAVCLAIDPHGNIYIADAPNDRVRKVSPSGIITTIAGNGHSGFAGDGGPARDALLNEPHGVAADAAGNVYIADLGNARIRRVSPDGIITTIAGGGLILPNAAGDATATRLRAPRNLTLDRAGNLYFSDMLDHRVYRVTPGGIISAIAGPGVLADPLLAGLNTPMGLAVGPDGALYIADNGRHRILKLLGGRTTALLTGGPPGTTAGAQLSAPKAVLADDAGNVYIADSGNLRVLKLTPAGERTVVVSATTPRLPGAAELHNIEDIGIDSSGGLSIAALRQVLKVSPEGALGVLAGDGTFDFRGEGVPANIARLRSPTAVAIDSQGSLFIADYGNDRVRKVGPGGILTTFAGNGAPAGVSDGTRATESRLQTPAALAIDSADRIWIAEERAHRIRLVETDGRIRSVAAPTDEVGGAPLTSPRGIAIDNAGNLYIADQNNYRIRKIDPTGVVTFIAGKGISGHSGDGGPAINAQISAVRGLAVDPSGNLYVADHTNNCIRKITPQGVITTVAGSGLRDFGGDGGPAPLAHLFGPSAVALDRDGNLYIADTFNNRVRKVYPDGIIETIAGNGQAGFGGNGGPATEGRLHSPTGVAVDPDGNVYVADQENHHIRKLTPLRPVRPPPGSEPTGLALHAATLRPDPVAPGQIVSIFGTGIGPAEGVGPALNPSGVLESAIGGARVLFDGQPAALLYVQAHQINAQAPYGIAGRAATNVEVLYQDTVRFRLTLPVAASSPGIFTYGGASGPAAALNEDGAPNSAFNPARPGSVITLFVTGEGGTNPPGIDGKPSAQPFPTPALPVTLTVGGQNADILFAGGAPGLVGVMQINARLPGGAITPGAVSVQLRIGTAVSQPGVTIAVR